MKYNWTSFIRKPLITATLFLAVGVSAQQLKKDAEMLDKKFQQTFPTSTQLTLPRAVLDAPIDPDKYFVGPSDVFGVEIWGGNPLSLTIPVTPEGTLIIPTVGEILVADLTLTEARNKVLAEIRKKYLTGQPTVTLYSPRPVNVRVSGDVRVPGSYTLYGSDRVEKAILEASKEEMPKAVASQTELQRIEQLEIERMLKRASKRNIVVKHRDGTMGRVDLQKFYATRNYSLNPYLREGDEVFVPQSETRRVIGVYGAVNQPDRLEFVDGDSFLEAIHMAYGFKVSAILDSVQLTRYNETQTMLMTTNVDARAILEGRSADIPLQPGDRLVVKARQEFREDYRVTIEGEVYYPGTYPITRNGTHLSEVLERAGGITPYAALTSAIIIRKSMGSDDISRERLMSLHGNVQREDTVSMILETDLRILQGEYVETNFEKLVRQRDSTQDVVLHPEDRIVVPNAKKTVYVFGQVVAPTHVPLVPGKDVAYYVQMAGGYTDRARSGDVVVIKRATRQWLAPSETTVEDGDYIWVPKVADRPFSYYLSIATSVITGALTIVLLVLQLQK